MSRGLFYSGVRKEERNLIINSLDNFEAPIYVEVGTNYGGTFIKILEWLSKNKNYSFCYGIDLYEGAIKEELSFKVGWPNRTQTHDIGGDFGLNTAKKDELKNALIKEGYTNFELLQGYSDFQIPLIDKKINVAFIDGNHTYKQTRLDFEKCYENSDINAYYIFHNTTESEYLQFYKDGGPWKVCNELMYDTRVEYITQAHTAKLFKRKK